MFAHSGWALLSYSVLACAKPCTTDGFGLLPEGVSILDTHFFPNTSALNLYGQPTAADPGYSPAYAWNFPSLCAVYASVTEGNSSYKLGLFLPEAWGGQFLAVGGYSFAGGVNWHDMSPGPWYGMATVTTDTGHLSAPSNLSWAADPVLREAWGSTAIHGAVVYGKLLVEAYYNSTISRSYYSGCSTGGRQGLKEIQDYPDSFDGLMIGAPAWNTKDYMPWLTQIGVWNLASNETRLNDVDFGTLAAFIQRECDSQDGLKDNITSLPDSCVINWDNITCGLSGNPSPCLNSTQVKIAQLIYGDYYIDDGTVFVHNGYGLSSEELWSTFLTGSSTTGFDGDYERYFLNYGAAWQTTSYNSSTVYDSRAREDSVATADRYNLRINSQGQYPKILMYHGLADGLIPTKSSELYYNRTQDTMLDADLPSFFRLFLVPGMQHCWDTPSPSAVVPSTTTVDAPWMFAGGGQAGYLQDFGFGDGWSVPGHENDSRYDAFTALMGWVEEDIPVESVVATMWKRESASVYSTGQHEHDEKSGLSKSARNMNRLLPVGQLSSMLVLFLLVLTVAAYKPLSDSFLRAVPSPGDDFDIDHGALLAPILIPRVPGSEGSIKVQQHFVDFFQRELPRWSIEWQNSTGTTPITELGNVPFRNIIFKREPPWTKSGQANLLTLVAHFDSKVTPNGFIGATDSAVPCAVLMHVARSIDQYLTQMHDEMVELGELGGSPEMDMGVQIVLLDGEEAFVSWTDTDSLYGARSLADSWENEPTMAAANFPNRLDQISLFVLLDLLGTSDPSIPSYFLPTHWAYRAMAKVEQRMRDLGLLESKPPAPFLPDSGRMTNEFGPARIGDDHQPFMAKGVDILHLIPSPFPWVWHTMKDDGAHLDMATTRDWAKITTAFALEWLDMMEVWPADQ